MITRKLDQRYDYKHKSDDESLYRNALKNRDKPGSEEIIRWYENGKRQPRPKFERLKRLIVKLRKEYTFGEIRAFSGDNVALGTLKAIASNQFGCVSESSADMLYYSIRKSCYNEKELDKEWHRIQKKLQARYESSKQMKPLAKRLGINYQQMMKIARDEYSSIPFDLVNQIKDKI